MPDDLANLVLAYMRRFAAKLDRVIGDVRDLTVRVTAVKENIAGVQRRLDRVEVRLGRIDTRLDLVVAPH